MTAMNHATEPISLEPRTDEGEAPERRSSWLLAIYRKYEYVILPASTFVVFLLLWELLPGLGLVKPLFTSSPTRVVKAAEWLFAHGLWNDIRVSVIEFA